MPELWGVDADADLSDPACYPYWFTNAIRHARKLGEEISVHVEVFAPFTHLLELFGYEQALYALLDAPDKCHKLLDVFASFGEAQIEIYAKEKPDAIDVSSAFAGAGFISMDMYREFVMPYEDRLYKKVNNLGLKSCVHTCGAIGDRLGLMAETHVDGVETLDPPPLGTVELSEAIEEFGKRFWFKGNLDAVNEMLNASDADFEKAVKQRLEIGMQGSGYILSSACSVAPAVDPNRLKLMVELAKEFGQYED
jgi:uroporphyrinogen decarboxylase